jgi:SCP-like extracellular
MHTNIKRVIAAAAIAVVPLTASSTALATPAAPQEAPAAAPAVPAQATAEGAQYADTVLTKVNDLRRSKGLQPVTRYKELDTIAQDWSEQQAKGNFSDHHKNYVSLYPKGWTKHGENVAWRTAGDDTGTEIFEWWLHSPKHYANMVDPNLNSIGIGFAQSNGIWYATQNFATYNPSNTPLTPTTTNSQPSRNTSNQAKPSTKSALATTTGPSMAVAAIITGLLGTGAFLVMRRRQAS